jgi:hypothetical protein
MSTLTSPSTVNTCVWASLTLEMKERTVKLMAQLAFNRIATQSGWFTNKESDYVQPSQQPKNSD